MFDCLWWMLLGECMEKFAWRVQVQWLELFHEL